MCDILTIFYCVYMLLHIFFIALHNTLCCMCMVVVSVLLFLYLYHITYVCLCAYVYISCKQAYLIMYVFLNFDMIWT
jgi:hypothetical protein